MLEAGGCEDACERVGSILMFRTAGFETARLALSAPTTSHSPGRAGPNMILQVLSLPADARDRMRPL